MKKFLYFMSFGLCVNMYATVRTVSNMPTTLAQFNNIQAAIDASISGDTIYVHGSPTPYPDFTITNKRLTIIGPGWAPIRNPIAYKAELKWVTITGTACSNTELQGLVFTTYVNIYVNSPNNIRFIRNIFQGQVSLTQGVGSNYTGYLFQDNIFQSGGMILGNSSSTYTNFLFQNNIFYENTTGNGNAYGLVNCQNVWFDHNLWYGPSGAAVNCFSGDCRGLTITNNIFVRRNSALNNSVSTFNNNITFNAGVDAPWLVNNNSDAGGNVAGQDPQMVDQAAVNGGTLDPLLNFTISTGPANNRGSDDKDMGLMYDPNGILNWTNSRMSRIPYVYLMNVLNPTIPAGGTLNVLVEARKSN